MGHFTSKLAREVSRLTGWWQKIFGRRYRAILVTPEEAAQIERMSYILSHGAKEGLVDSPRQWPGVHAVRALLGEEELKGYWFDRTKEYAARRRGKSFDRLKYATEEVLTLDPLPCWKHLSPEQRKAHITGLVAEIEAQAAAAREKKGIPSKGAAAVLLQDPESRPRRSKRSPAPFCHAASRAWRRRLRDAYAKFVADFRHAAERLKAGDRNAPFPVGSFPPALPFVGG
ncbi:MAG TPA: hypothetical protein VGX68_05855 [Thermoanaerobaculia bacterium]|nr:hypothetical protein [Thermoanaerobaculia bacterium]